MFQMTKKAHSNILHSKALQNLPELVFLGWKQTIWQSWARPTSMYISSRDDSKRDEAKAFCICLNGVPVQPVLINLFYWYSAPGIKTKSHLCLAHYFSHEIAESGKVWWQKKEKKTKRKPHFQLFVRLFFFEVWRQATDSPLSAARQQGD
jgi:hypothetical protein